MILTVGMRLPSVIMHIPIKNAITATCRTLHFANASTKFVGIIDSNSSITIPRFNSLLPVNDIIGKNIKLIIIVRTIMHRSKKKIF